MIDFGIPGGFSSMNRTVGLPAAIGARMILEGKIRVTGVHVRSCRKSMSRWLIELEKLGLHFHEAWERLD